MKSSLKMTLMAFTVLSAGFLPLAAYAAGNYTKPAKKDITVNKDFDQYAKLTEVKKEVQEAVDLHETAVTLLSDKKVLEEHKKSIEQYNETVRRLEANISCNKQQLGEYFSNPDAVWKKISAWAEDSARTLLAEASDSVGDSETTATLKKMNAELNAGNSGTSGVEMSSGASAKLDEATKQNEGIDLNNISEDASDIDLDSISEFSKIRWDIGAEVLKDLYANPSKWGSVKKKFTPWLDQQHVYNVYLSKRYAQMEQAYALPLGMTYPARPRVSADREGAYLPETYYNGEVPAASATTAAYSDQTASIDDVWCGKTAANMKKQCARVNKGDLMTKHAAYVAALEKLPLKEGASRPDMSAPYLPQAPLPPWRESVYILNVEKEIPELGSELPDPWFKVTQSIDNFSEDGELANLVSRKGNTVQYHKDAYDEATGEIKMGKDGKPMLAIPLTVNRISSYLALVSAEEEQLPVKERAEASIRQMNDSLLATFAKAGYTPRQGFDLANDADYQEALAKLRELEKEKVNAAKTEIAAMRSEFSGKLLPSVEQKINQEMTVMDALNADTNSLVRVTHENAAEINDLIREAVADAEANKAYEENVAKQMADTDPVPDVGCPVL